MTTKHDVINLHRQNPTWTVRQLADELGCNPAYVRATASRCSLTIPRSDQSYKEAFHRLHAAASTMLNKYVAQVSSGEAGYWNPEEEGSVIELRQALEFKP